MHWIDPDCLPETTGKVSQFLLNTQGDIDGMMLADGTEVHFPPHLSDAMDKHIKPGQSVKIRGVRAREGDVLAGIALETESGKSIVDQGPPKDHKEKKHEKKKHAEKDRAEKYVEGAVTRALHGPKGERRGLLLDDGVIIRFAPHEAGKIEPLMKAGTRIALNGAFTQTKHGVVVEPREIGVAGQKLQSIEPKKPKKHDHH